MSRYHEEKANLENQGWRAYRSAGGKSYFSKSGVSGLTVEIDQLTGETIIHKGCPEGFAEKHKPTLLHGGYRAGAGRPATGRKKKNYYVTEQEDTEIRKLIGKLREE